MVQTGCRFGFDMKTFQMRFRRQLTQTDNFQCDRAIETLLPRSIDKALTATAHFFQEFVVSKVGYFLGSARLLSLVIRLRRSSLRSRFGGVGSYDGRVASFEILRERAGYRFICEQTGF